MLNRRVAMAAGAAAALTAAIGKQALAQAFPSKAVKLIIPYPPGGGVDVLARVLAEQMRSSLGQSIVIENRPGGNTVIGGAAAASSAPDGYTLVWLTNLGLLSAPLLVKDIPFQPMTDLTPVAMIAISPYIICAHPSLPVKSLKDLVALSKAKPGSIRYGTAGSGSMAHLAMEELKTRTGADFTHIPYKGDAPALTDARAGTIEVITTNLTTLLPPVREGALRPLAVTSMKRLPQVPDVEAASETAPGFEMSVFNAVLAPAKTPADILAKLNAEFAKALASPEIRKRLDDNALIAGEGSPSEVKKQIEAAGDIVTRVIKANNITLD